ncbi:hypothetical protein DFH07DRAFT_942427 [Mycena maculata]|uniref:Uncharacterized protein n=1 Tax=Mycena maculata TaxID=230809 RepID=A0AAD7N795_9AGAR|nr:hypothetical protein DFH07DRAFT_942427 [Mycena maculata]
MIKPEQVAVPEVPEMEGNGMADMPENAEDRKGTNTRVAPLHIGHGGRGANGTVLPKIWGIADKGRPPAKGGTELISSIVIMLGVRSSRLAIILNYLTPSLWRQDDTPRSCGPIYNFGGPHLNQQAVRIWICKLNVSRVNETNAIQIKGQYAPLQDCQIKIGITSRDGVNITRWTPRMPRKISGGPLFEVLCLSSTSQFLVICRAKRGKRDLRDLRTWTQVRSVRKKTRGSPVGCSRNTTARKDREQMRIEDSGGNHVTPDGPGRVPEGVRSDPEEAGGSEQTPLEPNANVTDFVEGMHIPDGTRVTGSVPEGGRGNRD